MYTEMTIKTEDTDAAGGGSKVIGAEVGAKKLDGSSTGKGTTSSGDLLCGGGLFSESGADDLPKGFKGDFIHASLGAMALRRHSYCLLLPWVRSEPTLLPPT